MSLLGAGGGASGKIGWNNPTSLFLDLTVPFGICAISLCCSDNLLAEIFSSWFGVIGPYLDLLSLLSKTLHKSGSTSVLETRDLRSVLGGGKEGQLPQSLLNLLVNSSNSSLPGGLGGVPSLPPPPLPPGVLASSSLLSLILIGFLNS